MKKAKSLLLGIPIVGMCLTGCNSNTLDLTKRAPDYSKISATFNTFGYTPPTNGKYYEDGITISTGEDFRTVERYKEYKDAGMTILMLQNEDQYDHTPFETSELKKRMDDIQAAGLTKCIVCDTYLMGLCNATKDIVNPDEEYDLVTSDGSSICGGIKNFKSEEELENKVLELLTPFMNHPIYYGVIIRDEPFRCHLKNWCRVYKAIKKVSPNTYIEGNLLPYDNTASGYFRFTSEDPYGNPSTAKYEPTDEEAKAAYKQYLQDYVDWSGAERVMMDSYPFLVKNNGKVHYIKQNYFVGLQLLGQICYDNEIEFEGVLQSMGGKNSGNPTWQSPNAAALQWQMNTYLGLGCETFGYFTYWRKVWNQSAGEWFNDGESFISSNGTKTSVYYNVQNIHKEIQKMAPTLSCYKFLDSSCYTNGASAVDLTYIRNGTSKDLSLFKQSDFTLSDGGAAFVTELRDDVTLGKNQYMYMVLNALDPYYKAIEDDPNDDKTLMTYSIQFDAKKYNAVEVLYRGEKYLYALNNGKYTSTLDAGYAEYIMPYKA